MYKIADLIKNNDFEAYQTARYPDIPDGESVRFVDVDFSDTDFSRFVAEFFKFERCSMDGVSGLHGQPVTIEGGTARSIDLRGVRAIFKASGCDFSGLLYDDATKLAYGDNGSDAYSEFIDCVIDSSTKEHFQTQGVRFR